MGIDLMRTTSFKWHYILEKKLAVSKLYHYLTKMMNHAYTPLKYNWIGIFTEFWKGRAIENVQNCKKNNLAKRKILLKI